MKKNLLIVFAAIVAIALVVSGCALDESNVTEDDEYGYAVYFVCLLLGSFGEPGSTSVVVGDVQTITFTDMDYGTGVGATVSGTVVYDASGMPETEVGNLTFTGDPNGLNSIQTDMEYDGADYSGDFTVDGHTTSGADYQAYIEGAMGPSMTPSLRRK